MRIDIVVRVQCQFQIKFYFPRKGGYLHCWVQIVYNSNNRMLVSPDMEILLTHPYHFWNLSRFECSLTRVLWHCAPSKNWYTGIKLHFWHTMWNNVKSSFKYVRRNLIKRYLRKFVLVFVSPKRRVVSDDGMGAESRTRSDISIKKWRKSEHELRGERRSGRRKVSKERKVSTKMILFAIRWSLAR